MSERKELLFQSAKLASVDELQKALDDVTDIYEELSQRESADKLRTVLHILAAAGKDDCVDVVLTKADENAAALVSLKDADGNTPLHLCSHSPMVCYQLAAEAPGVCLLRNKAGMTPIDLALKNGTGEALNALLLACSGSSSSESLQAIKELTKQGAVPDTWAPNGQSALMLAAAADCAEGIDLLLAAGASPELQDAMGRTALMWAVGSGSVGALKALLRAGVSVAIRDRRGRNANDYADKPETKAALQERVKELESKAAAAQEALLAELMEEEERKAACKASKKAKKKAKAKQKKKGGSIASTVATVAEEAPSNAVAGPEAEQLQEEVEEDGFLPESGSGDGSSQRGSSASSGSPRSHLPTQPASPRKQPPQNGSEDTTTPQNVPALGAEAAGAASQQQRSPDWCTVSRKEKISHHPKTHAAGHHHHRRSPSAGSMTSASSIASHETDGSKQSGSERSVLRRVSAMAMAAQQAVQHPHLPAPVQRKALISRSTSGGEEVAAMFGGMAASPPPPPGAVTATAKPGSWASVAAQKSSVDNKVGEVKSAAVTPRKWADAVAAAPATAAAAQPPPPPPAAVTAQRPAPVSPRPVPGSSTELESVRKAAEEEIAALRGEIHRLKMKNAAAELAHHQELAAVLQDASIHEAAAVAKASNDERLACTIRFAALLQNNGVALANAIPGLLAGAGISTAGDLDLFLSSLNTPGGSGSAATHSSNNGPDLNDQLAALGFPQFGSSGGGGGKATAVSGSSLTAAMNVALGVSANNNPPNPTATNSSNGNGLGGGGNAPTPARAMPGTSLGGASSGPTSGGGFFENSPLSTSPFSYEVGEHLRGDFLGNHSAFMVPALETHTVSPPESSSESFLGNRGGSNWAAITNGWGNAAR